MGWPNAAEITEEQLANARTAIEGISEGLDRATNRTLLAHALPGLANALGIVIDANGGFITHKLSPLINDSDKGILSTFPPGQASGAQIFMAEPHEAGVQLSVYSYGVTTSEKKGIGRKVIVPSASYTEKSGIANQASDTVIVASDYNDHGLIADLYPFAVEDSGVSRTTGYARTAQMLCRFFLEATKGGK